MDYLVVKYKADFIGQPKKALLVFSTRQPSLHQYSTMAKNNYSSRKTPSNVIIRFVPQQTAWVVERMGKFSRILEPGLAVLVPFVDRIAYVQSLKESAIEIPTQSAITSDNVALVIDGVLYIRVFDAYKASYGVENVVYAITQLAQTSMRSEIGHLTLDHILRERQTLNTNITMVLNEAAQAWGVQCLRYEIKDITPPQDVQTAMRKQLTAERNKRAKILESEGERQSKVNEAEGQKSSRILASEGVKKSKINEAEGNKAALILNSEAAQLSTINTTEGNRQAMILEAQGEAEAIRLKAEAAATGIRVIAAAMEASPAGREAAAMTVAEKYMAEFGKIVGSSNTIVIPQAMGDMGAMIASGMKIMDNVRQQTL